MIQASGLLLLSHGSVVETGPDTLREHVSRLQKTGWGPVEHGFLNYGTPGFDEVVASLVTQHVQSIIIAPYFLVSGHFMTNEVPARIDTLQRTHPNLQFRLASALLSSPELSHAIVDVANDSSDWDAWLLIAHGSPLEESNRDIRSVIERLPRANTPPVTLGFLDCNTPAIPQALDQCIQSGARRILVIPYFLHKGRHVSADIPQAIAKVQAGRPDVKIGLAPHIGSSMHVTQCLSRLACEALDRADHTQTDTRSI